MNKNRVLAGTLAVTIVTASVGMSGVNVYAADTTESQKEEVIYINTDASGDVERVNAVNIFGKGSVTDYGDYSSVKMLNSTEPITLTGDKVTFKTDKEKVYYQGTMNDTEIPWNIKFTYKLDGKEVKPEDLAGKSGKLEIHIQIEENEKCKSDFYDSTALQAALTLDTEKCENIKAEGATLANVGANKQISYTVLPGNGLDATVTADVTDFEMDAVAVNGVKLDLNIDIDDEELMDKVTEIMDAAKELNDGAGELEDGTKTLADGGSSLKDGAASMDDGVSALDAGISSLDSGVGQMQDALDALNAQSGTLTGGSSEMLNALKMVQSELSGVFVTTDQLKQLTDSSAAIKQGITDAYNGAAALQASLSSENYKAALSGQGLDIDQLQAGNSAAIDNLSAQINDLYNSIAELQSQPDYDSNPVYAEQVSQMQAQIESLTQTVTLLSGNNAAIGGTESYLNAASAGTADLVAGLEQLKNSYDEFDAAIGTMVSSLSDLTVNMSTLKDAINQLTDSYENLDSGIGAYTDGVASIVGAYSQIVSGTESLASGSKTLVEGSSELKQGSSELYDGIVSLGDGTTQLKEGTQEFYEQTDGMDSKIEDELDDMLDSIAGGDAETTSFVSDKNGTIDSVQFVIKTAAIEKQEAETTVETKTEKTGFINKLLSLFGKE